MRIAFVLGNLTTHYEDVRQDLNDEMNALERVLMITLTYLTKDEN
jgi:hypothetical protein